jgi:tetratricopeptide (TPR) repeat protein
MELDWTAEAQRHKEDGNRLLGKGSLVEAAAAYRQASACLRVLAEGAADRAPWSPLHAAVGSNLGLVLLKLKQHRGAVEALDIVLAAEPGHEKALYRKSLCLQELGEERAAWAAVTAAVAANPANGEAVALKAKLRAALRLPEEEGGAEEGAATDAAAASPPQPRAMDAFAAGAKKMFQSNGKGLYEEKPAPAAVDPEGSGWAVAAGRAALRALTCGACARRPAKPAGKRV